MKLYDLLIGFIFKFINGLEIVIIFEGNMFLIFFVVLKDFDGKCLLEIKCIWFIFFLIFFLVI